MKLYLMRHGDSTLSARTDSERPLSEIGKQEISYLAKLILPFHIEVSDIWHSGKLRAQQTAEIISTAVVSKNSIESITDLEPMDFLASILDKIYASNDDFLLVGHMPFMGRLVSKLTTGEEDKNIVNFDTGCLVCLEKIASRYWSINWMLNPKI